ncbi:hypothetical protein B0T13DRAFT_519285 [Neurospora crassa]|nr:hypothetical protein B0T13DRAFT_519285 [Neurospora crassa]
MAITANKILLISTDLLPQSAQTGEWLMWLKWLRQPKESEIIYKATNNRHRRIESPRYRQPKNVQFPSANGDTWTGFPAHDYGRFSRAMTNLGDTESEFSVSQGSGQCLSRYYYPWIAVKKSWTLVMRADRLHQGVVLRASATTPMASKPVPSGQSSSKFDTGVIVNDTQKGNASSTVPGLALPKSTELNGWRVPDTHPRRTLASPLSPDRSDSPAPDPHSGRSSELGLGWPTNVRTVQPFDSLFSHHTWLTHSGHGSRPGNFFANDQPRRDEERRTSMVRAASARRLRYPDPDPARPNAKNQGQIGNLPPGRSRQGRV